MTVSPQAEVATFPSRFAGRRALVTGGGRGIGAAIARRLAAEGAAVVIASRTLAPALALAAEIGAEAIEVDVGEIEAAQAAVAAAGKLDILVNNAGFDDSFDFFTDTTPERWRGLLAVNLEGMFACAHAALPAMQAAAYGRVLNIGSEAGRIGSYGNAVYAATKGGVSAFTKSLARENARYDITVNALAVGPIETPLLQKVRATPGRGERMVGAMERMTLLKRLGSPEEVAAVAAFLVSDEASFVTGETLGVSGGMGLGG
jgi:2-hydroxycyclohexanecarboxyl-CoA dehydrogenase